MTSDMKRKRSEETARQTEIQSAIQEMMELRQAFDHGDFKDSNIPTMKFLRLCSFMVDVLDKIGPTMDVLRQDIHQNIQRLEQLCEAEPSASNLVGILEKERREGNARKTSSCCRAFVWLTRSMDFSVALLQKIATEPCKSMEQAVGESYMVTLKPWHGWIATAAFKVALQLLPDNKSFTDILKKKEDNMEALRQNTETLVSLLESFGLDRLKST